MERVSPNLRSVPAPTKVRRIQKVSWRLPLGPLHVWVDDTGTAQHETGSDPGESHFFKHGM